MDLKIKDKIAVVTGGGKGIGNGIALRLAQEGATVVVTDIKGDLAKSAVEDIRSRGGNGLALEMDVTKEEDIARMVRETLAAYKKIDILVNNAGGGSGPSYIVNYDVKDWDRTIELNLKSAFLCSKAVAADMITRKQGRIINISSISGKLGEVHIGPYCAAKFGVIGLTQVMAKELGRYSITVNAVCPGYVFTPGWMEIAQWLKDNFKAFADKSLEQIFENRVKSMTALGRPQTTADIASLVVYLASEEAGSITGQAINVDGGAVMH